MDEPSDHLILRENEIFALSSIYDELQVLDNKFSGCLKIPVEVDSGIPVTSFGEQETVHFLPSVEFHFRTSELYPESAAPEISLKCMWLSEREVLAIEASLLSIWKDTKEICLYNMIDNLSERAKLAFDMKYIDVPAKIFEEVLRFSESEEARRFNEGIYYCGICLEHKKGAECFRLPRCGHISCTVTLFGFITELKQCLKEYYGMCITEGFVTHVICTETECQIQGPPRPKTKADRELLPCNFSLTQA